MKRTRFFGFGFLVLYFDYGFASKTRIGILFVKKVDSPELQLTRIIRKKFLDLLKNDSLLGFWVTDLGTFGFLKKLGSCRALLCSILEATETAMKVK